MKKITLLILSLGLCLAGWSQTLNEGFDAATIPTGWTTQQVSGTANWAFGSAVMPTGTDFTSNAAIIDADANGSAGLDEAYLLSPVLDTSTLTNGIELSFDYALQDFAGDGDFEVEVFDGTNWISIFTISVDQNPVNVPFINVTAYSNSAFQIRFRYDDDGADTLVWGAGVDNVVLRELPSCIAPNSLSVVSSTTTTADLAWTSGGSGETLWDIELGSVGFIPTGTPTDVAVTNPYTATGLTANTEYDYYVRADCGGGDFSAYAGPFSFFTSCVAVADFNENFDSVSTPDLPNCWDSFSTVLATGTQPYVETSSLADETTPNGVRLYSGSLNGNIGSGATNEGETILVSPQLNNLSAGTHRIKFFADAGTATSTLEVGTMTDPTDPSTFTLLSALAPTTTHSEFIVNFDTYTGTDQYVAFRHIFVSTFDSMYLDNIVWEAIPSCVAASDIIVTSSTDTSAVLGWTNNAMATASIITYGAVGFDPLTAGTSIPGGADTATVTGLTSETAYDFYVTQDCSSTGNGLSSIAGPTSFTTPCSVIAAPYFVDFENFTAATSGFVSDQCWEEVSTTAYDWAIDNSGGTVSSGTGPSGAYSGTTFMFVEASNGATGDIATVLSPAVDLSALTVPTLSFYYHMYGSQITSLEVGVSTDNGATFTNELTITGQQQTDSADAWIQSTIDLSAYANQTVIVSFSTTKGTGTFDYEGDVSIDEVRFDEVPSCFTPTNVLVTATSIDGATIDFTNVNTSTNTNIEYGAPGFVQGTGTLVSYTTIPFSLTGLMSGTTYDFYLQSDCGMGDLTAWVGPFSFTTDCIAVADFDENFDGVTTPNLPNCWDSFATVSATGTQPYVETSTSADETAPNGVRLYSGSLTGNIGSGTTNEGETILISPQLNNLSAGTHRIKFFADAGTSTSTLEVGTITDPTDPGTFTSLTALAPTTTHSEFIVNFDSYAGTDQYIAFRHIFVGTFDSMYLDNIVWEAIPSCIAASDFVATSITDTSVALGWTNNAMATASTITYGPVGFDPLTAGTSIPGGTDTATITGLTAETAYDFYVTQDCSSTGNGLSNLVGPISITTLCSAFIAPYTEDFENAGALPNCWTLGGDDDWEFNTSGPNHVGNGGTLSGSTASGGYYAVLDDSDPTATDGQLNSPLVDVSGLSAPALSFYEISDNEGNANATLTVSVWDGAAWNVMGVYNTNTVGWELKVIDLGTLTFTGPAQARFSIADSGSFYDDIAIDDVNFDEAPSCVNVTAVSVDSVTADSATLSWTENNIPAGTAWEVVAVPAGDPAPVAGASNATTNPFTITSLTANTSYDVYVRADCSTAFVGPISLTTSCDIVTVYPYVTDFNNNVPNACWDEAGSGEIVDGPMTVGSSDWRANRSYENFAGTVIPSNAINLFSGNSDREWLLSEQYDMTGTSNDVLSIEVAVTNWTTSGASDATDTDMMGSDDQVDLLITTDAGISWTSLMTWTAANQPAVDGTREFIDLSSYTGTVQFAFFASDGTVNDLEDYDFHVGMFIIDGTAGNEDVFASTLSLYPNPVNGDVVTISMGQTSASSIEVAVFNTLGQQVMTRSFDQVNQTIKIDNISSLSQGMYFVKLSSGTQQATLKFIKE